MIAIYIKGLVYKIAQINKAIVSCNQRYYSVKSSQNVYLELLYITLQSCPKLQVSFKRSKKEFEVKGAEAIYDYLTELNAKIRQV